MSEEYIQEAVDDNMIEFSYGKWQADFIRLELIVRNGNQVKESFMKFCNEKIEEFRLSHNIQVAEIFSLRDSVNCKTS